MTCHLVTRDHRQHETRRIVVQPTAHQIVDHHPITRHCCHVVQQRNALLPIQVVEHSRTHHHIKGPGTKRQTQTVSLHERDRRGERLDGAPILEHSTMVIYSHYREMHPATLPPTRQDLWHIPRSGADI